MINLIKNIWFFRKELWNHRNFDYIFSLIILRRSLQGLKQSIEQNGKNGSFHYNNIIKNINETIAIMDSIEEDDYIEKARLALKLEFTTSSVFKEENGGTSFLEPAIGSWFIFDSRRVHRPGYWKFHEMEHNRYCLAASVK